MREAIPDFCGEITRDLQGELNKYYDPTKTGIGRHGDGERRMVVCARTGYHFPLIYQWYMRSKVISEEVRLDLEHGDVYVMSEKATGFDWKSSSFPTLRHCAGSANYIKLPDKHKPEGGNLDFALLPAKSKKAAAPKQQEEKKLECKRKTKAAAKEKPKASESGDDETSLARELIRLKKQLKKVQDMRKKVEELSDEPF